MEFAPSRATSDGQGAGKFGFLNGGRMPGSVLGRITVEGKHTGKQWAVPAAGMYLDFSDFGGAPCVFVRT